MSNSCWESTPNHEHQIVENIEGCTVTIAYTIVDHPVLYLHGIIEEPSYYEWDYLVTLDPIPSTATAAATVENLIADEDKLWKKCKKHWDEENAD